MSEPVAGRTGDARRVAVGLALAAALLGAGIAWYWPFFVDDSFITLRYADRLLDGRGLTWNDGERVEGYSNFLWLLLCAGLGALGLDLVTAARLLGVACTFAAVAAFVARARRTWPGVLVAASLAGTAPAAPWAIAGLETPLVLLANTAGLLFAERALAAPSLRPAFVAGAWFAAGCLTRPDEPLFAVAAAAAVALHRWRAAGARAAVAAAAALLAAPVAAVAAHTVFRLAYYGDWLPNTARVKVTDGGLWAAGFVYLAGACRVAWPLLLPAALAPFADRGRRLFAVGLAAGVLAWAAYVARVGGDFFPAWRFLAPALPMLALLAIASCERLAAGGRIARGAAVALAALALVGAPAAAWTDERTRWAAVEVWEWDHKHVGEALGEAFAAEQPRLALTAAGTIPYYSRLPAIDGHGLNDREMAREVSKLPATDALSASHRTAPHLLLERAPDLWFFFLQPEDSPIPVGPGDYPFLQGPGFAPLHRAFWLRAAERSVQPHHDGEYFEPFWARIDGKAGVVVRDGRVEVPCHLLGSYGLRGFGLEPPADPALRPAWERAVAAAQDWLSRRCVVRPRPPGAVLEVRGPGRVSFDALPLASGRWRLALETEPAEAAARWTLALAARDGAELPAADGAFAVAEPGAYELRCDPPQQGPFPLLVRRAVAVRE